MPAELLDPKNDYVFKRLLADSPRLLSALINAVRFDRPPIEVVRVLNPAILPEEFAGKAIVLDVLAQDANGHRFNVEMQTRCHPDWVARSIYYATRSLGHQLEEGENYEALRPAVGIHLLDFDLFEDRTAHALWRFNLRAEQAPDLKLSDELELNLVELPKARGMRGLPKAITAWVTFFERWNEEAAMAGIEDVSVHEAIRRLEVISGDEEARIRAMLREKAIRDERSWRNRAERAGREEGLAAGLEQGLQRGRTEGESRILERQLARRFGPLPEPVVTRLRGADAETLERWSDRIFDARTLDDVFAGG